MAVRKSALCRCRSQNVCHLFKSRFKACGKIVWEPLCSVSVIAAQFNLIVNAAELRELSAP
jgi:hypothetical protein